MNRFENERERQKMLKSNSDRLDGQETPSVPRHSNGPDEPSRNEQSDDVYLSQEEMGMNASKEEKYKVWGYAAKSDPDWNHKGHFIGAASTIEEAFKLKNSAKSVGWKTVCIFDGDLIVDPDFWAGRKHPL